MALLIVDADGRQIVYDRFALDLELARQIVDADFFQIGSQFLVLGSLTWYSVLGTRNLLLALMRLFAVHVDFSRIGFTCGRRVFYAFHCIRLQRLPGVGEVAHAV